MKHTAVKHLMKSLFLSLPKFQNIEHGSENGGLETGGFQIMLDVGILGWG
jgi:hypothetical protein